MTTLVAGRAQAELDRRLANGAAEIGLSLGRGARDKLLQYLVLLEKWNQVYNLTAIRDREKMVSGHLLDWVVRPGIQVTLLDSNHKKAAFLRQAVADLQLKNATVVSERAETWQSAEKFDCIISRAFAEIAEFIALTDHLLAPGGVFAAMKGVHPFEEIERLPPALRVKQVHALDIPGLGAQRHLVMIERA